MCACMYIESREYPDCIHLISVLELYEGSLPSFPARFLWQGITSITLNTLFNISISQILGSLLWVFTTIMTFSSLVSTLSGSIPKSQRSKNRLVLLSFSSIASVLVTLWVWSICQSNIEFEQLQLDRLQKVSPPQRVAFHEEDSEGLGGIDHSPCYYLQDAKEVVIIMKTGASEARQKIPIHLATTFRCVPHFII